MAAGLGTAAVGAMLLPTIPRHPQPATPIVPKTTPAISVSEPATDTAIADMSEKSAETAPLVLT